MAKKPDKKIDPLLEAILEDNARFNQEVLRMIAERSKAGDKCVADILCKHTECLKKILLHRIK
jgi:DNA-binding ferritin-like protein